MNTEPSAALRELLSGSTATVLPGCWDGISARLINRSDFEGAHLSGFAVAASLLGQPDIGLVTQTEMADAAARVAAVLNVPLLADADTGYGNEFNVERTVGLYLRAGVGGLHLEDQVMPKRCGHMAGKDVIARDDMVAKVGAAVAERERCQRDVVIVARTDARAVEGLESAIDRGRAYRDAGADALFVEALDGRNEVIAVAEAFADVPLVYNASAARAPIFTLAELSELGFALVLAPIAALLAATAAVERELTTLASTGPTDPAERGAVSYADFLDVVGWEEVARREG